MKHHVTAALGVALVAASAAEADRQAFEPTYIKAPFVEQFTSDWSERWSSSSATKKQEGGEVFSYSGVWSVEEPTVLPGLAGDTGLVAKSKAAQHAISAQFPEPVDVAAAMKAGKPLVVQYETKTQNGLSCGGAYLKLLTESSEGIQAKEFSDKTPYTIMFGPDKCGSTNKVHFIFRHPHPKTGELQEKHLTNGPYPKLGKTSALYTLVVNPDQTYDIRVNGEVKKAGSLLEDFDPPVNPAKEIDDPASTKPEDWVDSPMIPDPEAKKPEDWDEDAPPSILDEEAVKPEDWLDDEQGVIPDPDAKKPEEWDDEEDGEWTAPMIPNPKCEAASGCGPWIRPMKTNPAYKGKWSAPQIKNPAYKGLWSPAKIANPDYVEDLTPSHFTKIGGIGFEIWTMDEDILFDNIYVGHSIDDAQKLGNETFSAKIIIEQGREEKELEALARKTAAEEGIKINTAWDKVKDKVNDFVLAARADPVAAIKASPDVAGGLAAAVAGLFGLVGILGAVLGGSSKPAKPAAKPAKKVDEPKAKSTAVAAASTEKAKKRPAAAKVEDDDE